MKMPWEIQLFLYETLQRGVKDFKLEKILKENCENHSPQFDNEIKFIQIIQKMIDSDQNSKIYSELLKELKLLLLNEELKIKNTNFCLKNELITLIAFCYENGLGTNKDFDRAFLYYSKAANLDHPEANYHLGLCYKNGQGTLTNEKEAIIYFAKASMLGSLSGTVELGLHYESHANNNDCKKKAILNFELAAKHHHTGAHLLLAQRYESGKMLKKDIKKAYEHYIISASQGNVCAKLILANLISENKNFEKDPALVRKLYQEAVENKYITAIIFLSRSYYELQTKKDCHRAILLAQYSYEYSNNLSWEKFYPLILNIINSCFHFLENEDDDIIPQSLIDYDNNPLACSLEHYESAALNNHGLALSTIGYCYQTGMGHLRNLETAVSYYKAAIEKRIRCHKELWVCFQEMLLRKKITEKEILGWFETYCKITIENLNKKDKNVDLDPLIILAEIYEQVLLNNEPKYLVAMELYEKALKELNSKNRKNTKEDTEDKLKVENKLKDLSFMESYKSTLKNLKSFSSWKKDFPDVLANIIVEYAYENNESKQNKDKKKILFKI